MISERDDIMFGKRPDGRRIKNLDPMQMIMPYVMKTRTDSMNMYEDTFACEPMDAYIKEKAEEGISLSYMHIIIAAVVRLIALRPQLNRFCMNGKIYARPKIWVSFVVHPTLRDESVGTTIKLCFEGTETILEVAEKINEYVEITHNYERESEYNLWFTLLTPTLERQKEILDTIEKQKGVRRLLSLPTTKKFKISVQFKL